MCHDFKENRRKNALSLLIRLLSVQDIPNTGSKYGKHYQKNIIKIVETSSKQQSAKAKSCSSPRLPKQKEKQETTDQSQHGSKQHSFYQILRR